jgi:hypothetical protein
VWLEKVASDVCSWSCSYLLSRLNEEYEDQFPEALASTSSLAKTGAHTYWARDAVKVLVTGAGVLPGVWRRLLDKFFTTVSIQQVSHTKVYRCAQDGLSVDSADLRWHLSLVSLLPSWWPACSLKLEWR